MVENIKNTDRIVVDLHMLQVDYNEAKIKALKQDISNKYNVPVKNIDINFIPVTINKDGEKISISGDIIKNIQDAGFQRELMKEHIRINGYEGINFDDIEAIDRDINSRVEFDQYSKYKSYKFKYVKWSNYASYGPDNYFDFTTLKGLVLLNGEPANQCGKTTFAIDLLRFALFGKSKKSPTLDSVFNAYRPEATECVVEACLEIDGDDYVIRRTVTRPELKKRTKKSKCKQMIQYYRCINGVLDEIENCEAESTTQTNNIIRESVGSVDDYNLVVSATSKSLADLIDMGQSDKSKLFSRWMGLLTVEQKEEVAKDIWKARSKTLLSNTYNKESLNQEISDLKVVNEDNRKHILMLEDELNKANSNIIEFNKNKTDILTSIKEVKDGLDSIDITTIKSRIEGNKSLLEQKRGQFNIAKNEYSLVKDSVFNEDGLKSEMERLELLNSVKNDIENKNSELRTEIRIIREDIERIKTLMKQGVCATCGHKIEADEQQGFIDKDNEKQNRLIEEGKNNKKVLDDTINAINECNNKIVKFNEDKDNVNKKVQIELKLTALKATIDKLKLEISNDENIIEDIKKNEENIKYNNELRLKVNIIDESIKTETAIKDTKIRDIESVKGYISTNDKSISDRELMIKKLDEEEILIKNWKLYLEMVGRNGIIKLVLKEALPIINNEISRILNGLCDFEVILDIDDKNNVIMSLKRHGVELDLGTCSSGFESVMASLALRSALAGISSISRPNFLVLDEILDGVAVCNYDNVHELYKRIMNNYNFIIHVTHNELLYDWHDCNICVVKDENLISKLEIRR